MDDLETLGYRCHTRTPTFARRVNEARDLLREAAGLGRCAVFISGGKDSLALAHLAGETLGPLDGFFIDSGAEPPEALETVAAWRARGYPVETVHPELSIIEMMQQVGAFGYDGSERLDGAWRWPKSAWKAVLIAEPARRVRERGYPVALLGLRAEESRGRAISLRRHGAVHRRADGAIIASPLASWRGRDVIAYCVDRGLPLSAIYTGDGSTPRELRRTGTMMGATGRTQGRWAELRARCPDVFHDLQSMFPDMALWT